MKSKRQQALIELIKTQICPTQEDLQNGLLKAGFNVTQSTVSRDIKELELIKGRDANGNYRYLQSSVSMHSRNTEHYREMFAKSVISVDYSLNIVVVKCYTGMASSACVALDAMLGDKMLGSLAGEDTIITITRGEAESKELTEILKNLL